MQEFQHRCWRARTSVPSSRVDTRSDPVLFRTQLVARVGAAQRARAPAAVLAGVDELPEVGDAVEVLAGGVLGGERRRALVEREVPEGVLVCFGEADHRGRGLGDVFCEVGLFWPGGDDAGE